MEHVKKYKKTITGTAGRLINLNGYMEREKQMKQDLAHRRHYNYAQHQMVKMMQMGEHNNRSMPEGHF